MYSYTYDAATGGILMNSSPTVFSKEPRPVWAEEMDILGFSQYWDYDKQNDIPYMWAESNVYWYRGTQIAKTKGGNLYTAPELIPTRTEDGHVPFSKEDGGSLQSIDIQGMCRQNQELMTIVEGSTVKKIVKEYEKFKNRLDIFHVAFSGGKDSAVLLDLIKKALPIGSFVVIFGDTGMEFPDTYDVVNKTKAQCEKDGTPFYIARSHFEPSKSWKLFGPPARVLRWCCSVHKSTPQTLKMREITGKDDYIGMDFVGVRAHESVNRSKYEYENFGKKQKGQYSYNPILEWTSAEVWLYIFMNKVLINETYKKGNSRAGCLFCPMGGGKGDYFQNAAYPNEIGKYISLIKQMDVRDANNEKALNSYVSNGGWNARKNGRDLILASKRCSEDIIDGKYIITVISPTTDWREWIKTIGNVPFEFQYEDIENGYKIICPLSAVKTFPNIFKKFKQVFRKASHCVGCRVCETNCRNGCISFESGLKITDCVQCGQCHDIDDGCLVFHSVKTNTGEGFMKKESINSFANHAPKPNWLQEFFDFGNDYWNEGNNALGKNQVPMFKRFLRECGILDSKNKTTKLFKIVKQMGWTNNSSWGLMLSNLAYNRQCRWYIENMDIGVNYRRSYISDLLVSEGVKKDDATSIINAFKRFCDLPLGTSLNWGRIEENGRQISSLCRLKCMVDDKRVILFSLYRFAEKCNLNGGFNASYLLDETVEHEGVSPVRLFGLYDEEELRSVLLGLSARYPDFINATYTNDLQSISLRDKKPSDVLQLFEEEY
jgi:hypothetical protein